MRMSSQHMELHMNCGLRARAHVCVRVGVGLLTFPQFCHMLRLKFQSVSKTVYMYL